MTHEEQIAVCEQFRLGEPLSCDPLGGTRNHNFRLTTSRGQFVVRDRYSGYRDPARIAFDHAAINFLHAKGAAVVPPIQAIADESFWQQGERLWEVFPFIPGQHFRDGNIDDLRALAVAMAKFHEAGRNFASRCNKLGPRGETDPRELRELIEKLRPDASAEVPLYEGWIASASRDLFDESFASLPHTLIHGDIQPANILMTPLPLPGTPGRGQGRGVRTVDLQSAPTSDRMVPPPLPNPLPGVPGRGSECVFVDMDWCDNRPRIYDLAFAILLCCAKHESPIDGGDIWSLTQPPRVQSSLAQLFLTTYNDQGGPLEVREIDALRPQIILSWCSVRLAGAMKVEPARRAEFLARPPHDDSFALTPSSRYARNIARRRL